MCALRLSLRVNTVLQKGQWQFCDWWERMWCQRLLTDLPHWRQLYNWGPWGLQSPGIGMNMLYPLVASAPLITHVSGGREGGGIQQESRSSAGWVRREISSSLFSATSLANTGTEREREGEIPLSPWQHMILQSHHSHSLSSIIRLLIIKYSPPYSSSSSLSQLCMLVILT